MKSLCAAAGGCERAAQKRGFCRKHYERWKAHGTTELVGHVHKHPTEEARLAARRASIRAWAARNPDKRLDAKLRRDFGLSLAQYNRVLTEQGGVCAICRGGSDRGTRLVVDHDHVTGVVRGLLCHACNLAVGLIDDRPDVLERAADYLKRSRQCAVA